MVVILIAKLSERHFEGRIRNGTGPRSHLIPGTPICYGTTVKDVVEEAKSHLSPSLVRKYRGLHIRIEVREDPALSP